jgi:hypothetical protein
MKRKVIGLLHNSGRPEPGDLNVMAALSRIVEGMGCRSDKVQAKLQDQEQPGCDGKGRVRGGYSLNGSYFFLRDRLEVWALALACSNESLAAETRPAAELPPASAESTGGGGSIPEATVAGSGEDNCSWSSGNAMGPLLQRVMRRECVCGSAGLGEVGVQT